MGDSTPRIQADFNGVFGDLLCISHSEAATTESGETVTEGMELVVYESDIEDGKPAFLVARGRAVVSPPDFQHNGSRWCLRIDERGVRHEASLDDA